ncbi:energy transducer TonB [Acinetobacter silvestris]|uniref:TonB C-terminal domain-containing protein n=1 Tax=Acinetobacter silvestris TaxID=1977882 RepID=A0A1Y3CCA2_9GAMM|nr:energy transducer TonB [Acinetobacter silvestris]OTG64689.1 hypothetical protein B9T28_10820 [Acinetobacter silvestris]
MSQSSIASLQSSPSMKKTVLTALLAVVIGHMGVLWAVSNMKAPELKPIEKTPLKVKFLKLVEDTPPPPVPPKPIKPKVQPSKPKVEPVLPKPVVKPKVIATTTPKIDKKTIQQDDTQEKLKQEKLKQEQQKLENQRVIDEQKRLDQVKKDQAFKDQQAREQAARDQAARDQAERDKAESDAKNAPRKFSAGDVSWARKPRLSFTNKDLENAKRTVVVNIVATADGKITNVKVTKSSGLTALDDKVLRAVRGAKFVASKDGRAIYGDLPFELELN